MQGSFKAYSAAFVFISKRKSTSSKAHLLVEFYDNEHLSLISVGDGSTAELLKDLYISGLRSHPIMKYKDLVSPIPSVGQQL